MEMLQGVWKQHLRPRAVVGYGVKIFLPSPPNYVTRSPGCLRTCFWGRGGVNAEIHLLCCVLSCAVYMKVFRQDYSWAGAARICQYVDATPESNNCRW